MTGRDLILYILANGLEDEPIIKDGMIIGFETEESFAVKNNIGVATVRVLAELGSISSVKIGDKFYIPATEKYEPGKEELIWIG